MRESCRPRRPVLRAFVGAAPVLLVALVVRHVRAEAATAKDGGAQAEPDGSRQSATVSPAAAATKSVSAELPQLSKRPDGSYAYRGTGFDAVIEPNGTVRMHDVSARSRFGVMPRPTANGQWMVMFFESKYDIFGWLDRKFKNDPYRSERHRFFDGTLALREQLATRAAASQMLRTLESLWSQAELDFAERKRRIFALWDENSEDEVGQIGRAQIVTFVRTHCPPDGPRGFSPALLEALNAKRRSRALFAPYDK